MPPACTPADITFPTDLKILNEARETSEKIIDVLHWPHRGKLKKRMYKLLLVISEVYRQQKWMYDQKAKRIDDRIVNIYQPHVRPIKRGKAGAATEFGAKISVRAVDG